MWQSLPKEYVPVNMSQMRRFLLVNSTEMFGATSFKCLFKYHFAMYSPIINIRSPIINFSQKRTKQKSLPLQTSFFSFFTICFSRSAILFPFFIPSPAAVPGGVSPNSPAQTEQLFLSSFGLTGGGRRLKASLVEEGCSEIWRTDMRLGVLALLVQYPTFH